MATTKKVNKGLVKLKKINARAKVIRENAGKRTETVKVVKYNMPQKEAIKRAAKALYSKQKQTKIKFGKSKKR